MSPIQLPGPPSLQLLSLLVGLQWYLIGSWTPGQIVPSWKRHLGAGEVEL